MVWSEIAEVEARSALTGHAVPASMVLDALAETGVTHFVTVPDYVQLSVNHKLSSGYLSDVEVVNCATEDEAVCIGLGLHVGGKRPWLSMQNQGLFASANALRAVCLEARTPLPILVGQWGRELENLGHRASQSKRIVVQKTEALVDALGFPSFRLESVTDISVIQEAARTAVKLETAAIVLVGAHTSWD